MKLKVRTDKGRIVRVNDAEEKIELVESDIKKLKELIPYMDVLIALLKDEEKGFNENEAADELGAEDFGKKKEFEAEEEEEVVEDDIPDEEKLDDGDEVEEEDYKISETVHDSKKSFGSIEKRVVNDSVDSEIANDNDIAQAWAKRYGG